MPFHHIFLGPYTRSTSKGIYTIRLDDDTGALSKLTLAAEATNPSWITFSPDKKHLYAIHDSTAQALAFVVTPPPKLEVAMPKSEVPNHETVLKAAQGEGKFIRQSGGKGQYGHVIVKIEPAPKGQGVKVINEIVGSAIPEKFIQPATEGILEGAHVGVVAGFPVVDVIIRLVDGSFHEIDSSELAFKMAGIFAFKDAMKKADPILRDSITGVQVATPPAGYSLVPLPAADAPRANAPSHLAVDATGLVLLAANYRDGQAVAIPIHPDGTLGSPKLTPHTGSGPNKERQNKSFVHSVTLSPDNRFAIFCDLGVDKIFSYALDPLTATLTPANPPWVATAPGAGPRHFKFGADGCFAYAINELGNTIVAYTYTAATGTLTPLQTVSTLPADFSGKSIAAEIRVHPSGKFLYGSNRGYDSIASFAIDSATGRLTPIEIVPSGGKAPRNFDFSPNGKWLVCAHQDSDNLTVFRVDPATGKLTPTPHTATVAMCVCVLFYD